MILAPRAFELIDRLQAAPSLEAVWETYMAASEAAGLEFGSAAYRYRPLDRADTMLAETLPTGWLAHYAEQGHQHCSPIMQRSGGPLPFSWRMTDWDGMLTPRQRRWREDNLGAGIAHGFNIPDRSGAEPKIITLCGSGAEHEIHPHDLQTLKFAAFEVCARMGELTPSAARPMAPLPLSGRESECLTWVAGGKSDWEIGEILGLSQKTVNHHVERAKQKLESPTRLQAVVIALRYAMIHV